MIGECATEGNYQCIRTCEAFETLTCSAAWRLRSTIAPERMPEFVAQKMNISGPAPLIADVSPERALAANAMPVKIDT